MRIGIVPDPMLFQRDAALQVQVRETLRALAALLQYQGGPLSVVPFTGAPESAERVDAVHVFSASGANPRLIGMAVATGVPLVFSPLATPGRGGGDGHLRRALDQAVVIVATGMAEKRAIGRDGDASRVRLLGNGVGAAQFSACGELFRQRTGLRKPFVLIGGPLAPQHQQLALAQSLAAQGVPLVVEGESRAPEVLRQIQALPGVLCVGGLGHDRDMLRSACAAASVLVLPCQGDPSARVVLDALAAGTPVVLSVAGAIDVPDDAAVLRQVLPGDAAARQRAVQDLLLDPPSRDRVRSAVAPYSWERAALQLAACYAAAARCGTPLAA